MRTLLVSSRRERLDARDEKTGSLRSTSRRTNCGLIVGKIEDDIAENPRRKGRRVVVDIMHLAVTTGLRLGEITSLRWDDVRLFEPPRRTRSGGWQYGWLSVRSTDGAETKTGDEDRVPVVPQSYQLLLRVRKTAGPSGFLFEAVRNEKAIQGWWVSKIFRHYRRKAGIREEIHFHSLRHTCASWLAEQGVDLKVIQEVLRHSNIKQTMRYAHLIPEVVSEKMVSAFKEIDLAAAASASGRNRETIGKKAREEKSPYPQVLGAQGVTSRGFPSTAYGI